MNHRCCNWLKYLTCTRWSCVGIASARLSPCLLTYHRSLSNRRPCGASPPQPPQPPPPFPPLPSPGAALLPQPSASGPRRCCSGRWGGWGPGRAGGAGGPEGTRWRWRWRRRAPCGAVRPRCVFQVRFPSGFFDESEAAAGARSRGWAGARPARRSEAWRTSCTATPRWATACRRAWTSSYRCGGCGRPGAGLEGLPAAASPWHGGGLQPGAPDKGKRLSVCLCGCVCGCLSVCLCVFLKQHFPRSLGPVNGQPAEPRTPQSVCCSDARFRWLFLSRDLCIAQTS